MVLVSEKIDTPTAGAQLRNIKQTVSISDIFSTVLPPAVLIEVQKEMGAENLMYGATKVPIADIYKMFAATILLRASRPHVDKGQLQNVFRVVYKEAVNLLGNKGCLGIN